MYEYIPQDGGALERIISHVSMRRSRHFMDAADWVFGRHHQLMFTYIFLFGRRPNSVIEIARFDSKLQLERNRCEGKQAK